MRGRLWEGCECQRSECTCQVQPDVRPDQEVVTSIDRQWALDRALIEWAGSSIETVIERAEAFLEYVRKGKTNG